MLEQAAQELTSDFSKMKAEGMFYDSPPPLSEILEVLTDLESETNGKPINP